MAHFFQAKPLLKQNEDPESLLTGSCSLVVRDCHLVKNRKWLGFCQILPDYKKVVSGGEFMNNIGGSIPPAGAGSCAANGSLAVPDCRVAACR